MVVNGYRFICGLFIEKIHFMFSFYFLVLYFFSYFNLFASWSDGAGPAGIFCVLHNALQQLRINGEVDIFTTVRQIQIRRTEVITKMVKQKQKQNTKAIQFRSSCCKLGSLTYRTISLELVVMNIQVMKVFYI